MKRFLTIISFLVSGSIAQAQDSAVFTLKKCVETAYQNSLTIKQSELASDNSGINYNQAKSNQLPNLGADLNHGLNQGRSIDPFTNTYINQQVFYGNYGLGSSIVLFNGGQLRNIAKQTKEGYEASKMDLQQSKDNLMLNVLLAYLQVLNNQEQWHQAANQLALTKKQVERLTVLNDQGAIVPSQLYELKGQQASDELALITSRNAMETSKLLLCQLMNVPYTSTFTVEQITADDYAIKYEADANKIYDDAIGFLASVKAADYRSKAAAFAVRAARGGYAPQVSFGANIYTNYSNAAQSQIFLNTFQSPSGDFVKVGNDELPVITTRNNYQVQKIAYTDQFKNNYSTSLGLNIRIPIFNQNRTKNNIALAKNEVKNATYVLETTKIQLKQSIEQSVLNMNAAYEKYILLLQQVQDFDAAFKIADVRYKSGVTTQVDYLIAKNNSDKAAINLIMAKYDYIFRMKILDYYQNKLNL